MFNPVIHYLSKFKKISPPDDFLKKEISILIEKEIGIPIQKKNVEINRGIIFIKEKPIIKNEIFLNKKNILEKIRIISVDKKIYDIK